MHAFIEVYSTLRLLLLLLAQICLSSRISPITQVNQKGSQFFFHSTLCENFFFSNQIKFKFFFFLERPFSFIFLTMRFVCFFFDFRFSIFFFCFFCICECTHSEYAQTRAHYLFLKELISQIDILRAK